MPYETDLDTAFTILLGKAQGTISPTPVPTPTATPVATTRVVNIPFDIGVDGTVLATNKHLTFRLGLNGTARVLSWSLAGFVTGTPTAGTIVIDVLTGSSIGSLSSICGGDEPALTAQTSLTEQSVTSNWTPGITDPSWIQAKVLTTGGTLHRAALTLRVSVE